MHVNQINEPKILVNKYVLIDIDRYKIQIYMYHFKDFSLKMILSISQQKPSLKELKSFHYSLQMLARFKIQFLKCEHCIFSPHTLGKL